MRRVPQEPVLRTEYLLRTREGGFRYRISLLYQKSLFFTPSAPENASRTTGGCSAHRAHIPYHRRPFPVPNEPNAKNAGERALFQYSTIGKFPTNARGKRPPTAPQSSLSLPPKHICQVFCVNNLTFISLQYQKCYFMTIGKQIKQKIDSFPTGVVFTISDFGFDPSYDLALAKALSRMTTSGELCKISKGKYYKPKETLLGRIKPPVTEIVKDFLEKDGKIIGYITGAQAFATMGLTSQISSAIMIGSGKYRRPLQRGEYKISFLKQDNPITKDNIEFLRILDAIKLIRDIPAVSPDTACKAIISLIQSLSPQSSEELEKLSLSYTSYVRAMLGAMLEYIGRPTAIVRKSLNGVSSYKLPISESVLPNKSNWNIYEPARK